MTTYAVLDASMEQTAIYADDENGRILAEG